MQAVATFPRRHTDLLAFEAGAFEEVDSGLEEAVVSLAARGHGRTVKKHVTDGKDIKRISN